MRPNRTRMNVAAISTYIGEFFFGGVDPSMPHLVLILAAIAGGLAVGGGIIWEAARAGHLYTLPTALVFFGVIIEAAATVILFEFDEGISRHQQFIIEVQNDKIIALEKQLAKRHIDAAQFCKFIEGRAKAPTEIMFLREDWDAFQLAIQFRDVLRSCGWEVSGPTAVPPGDILLNAPSVASVGGQDAGVTVVVRVDTQEEMAQVQKSVADTPSHTLGEAIGAQLGTAGITAVGPAALHAPAPGTLRIVVGPTPRKP